MHRKARGFTLIELLVVVSIASAMAGLVVMPMAKWFASAKQRAEVAEIHSTVQHGINMAILKAQTLKLEPQSALREPWQWPAAWRLSQGQLDISAVGYCKGGALSFTNGEHNAKVLIDASSCAVRVESANASNQN